MFLKSYFFHIGLECSSNKLFYCSRFRLNPLENELVNERSCFLFTLVLCTQVKLRAPLSFVQFVAFYNDLRNCKQTFWEMNLSLCHKIKHYNAYVSAT